MVSGYTTEVSDGFDCTQNLTVTLGATTLRNGIDYELDYANNINPGVATVHVIGIGNYITVVKPNTSKKH